MDKLKTRELKKLPKGKYHDGDGLYIRILREGKGLWTYRFAINKKCHEMSLGTYPEVRLSEARKKLLEQRRLKVNNVNPLDEKRKDNIKNPEHYNKGGIEPIEYITKNKLSYCEGNVIKYITRWRHKGGLEDLKKAKQYIDFIIEKETK